MNQSHQNNAIVIGAGLSGLAAARALHARGVPVTILEASSRTADPWRAWHPQLRLKIRWHFAKLPGARMTRKDGVYVRRDTVVSYLESYAHSLRAEIMFKTRVTKLTRDVDVWRVRTDRGEYVPANRIAEAIVRTSQFASPHKQRTSTRNFPPVDLVQSPSIR